MGQGESTLQNLHVTTRRLVSERIASTDALWCSIFSVRDTIFPNCVLAIKVLDGHQ
jgi:hypothetical protein